jgi:hypothetical protein
MATRSRQVPNHLQELAYLVVLERFAVTPRDPDVALVSLKEKNVSTNKKHLIKGEVIPCIVRQS